MFDIKIHLTQALLESALRLVVLRILGRTLPHDFLRAVQSALIVSELVISPLFKKLDPIRSVKEHLF